MLEMNLIQERPALKVEFRSSLAAILFGSMSLVIDADAMEGFDQWVYATHSALPADLREDAAVALTIVAKSCVYFAWVNQLPDNSPVHGNFAAYITWLNQFTEQDFQTLINGTVQVITHGCEAEGKPAPSLDAADEEALRSCFTDKYDPVIVDRIIALMHKPVELKTLLLSVITRFWELFYRREYERCKILAERSVEYHMKRSHSADLATLFTDVTGRRFPKDYEGHEEVVRVIFVPSCHVGPYVMLIECDDAQNTLMIHYNCRPTGTPEHEEALPIYDLFPPLKALADETRLQILSLLVGKELYAQEIVDQLDISQSAVSRHLQLMVTGGLLDVRKQDSMK
ncbi:MAG: ArsR family transcriptional regulator, partial [Anaerolineales bacterium]